MGRVGKIHFLCLGLALLMLFLFLGWRISVRGQWLDILLSVAPFITACYVLIRRFRKLQLAGKIYFIAMPVINLLLAPLYLFGTICFQLPKLAEAKNYEARTRPGVLSPRAANLIKKSFIFEKVLSGNIYYDWEEAADDKSIRIVFKPDSVGLSVPVYKGRDTVYFFAD